MSHQSINKFFNEELQSCILRWEKYKASVNVYGTNFMKT